MPLGGQLIWGATAGMLRALYERLYGAPDPEWAQAAADHG